MAELRDLLEVYGALDEAAASDPAARAVVDQFLPGASANTGWYGELERFFFKDDARDTPDLGAACERIANDTRRAENAPTEEAGLDEQDRTRPLTAPQKSRLLYGLSVAARVRQAAPASALAATSEDDFEEAMVNGLAACGPKRISMADRTTAATENVSDYLSAMRLELTGPDQFYGLRRALATEGIPAGGRLAEVELVDPETVSIPLCGAATRVVDGIRCVVVDTTMSDPIVTLANLKRVVNPFNWDKNYRDFFIRMDEYEPKFRDDNWRRVRERVGFRGFEDTHIVTGLKYFATEAPGEARIDYDLDDPTPAPGCDGKVLVDKGYINMRADNDGRDENHPGVRVRTRKVVHIQGLSPYAQKRLVCLTGYGTASNEFLLNPARDPDAIHGRQEFTFYDRDDAAEPPETSSGGADQPDTHVVATAVGLWADAVQDLTSDYFDLAEKWLGGRLSLGDVTNYSQHVTGRIISAPLEFLEKVNQPRHPQGGPGGTRGGRP
ncbi:hypothetical protein [Mycobacterium sp. NPDC050041]|uniref:hypothetical protein n=1 Tax=Mycobacterium sp. NPDC050041 TaxID=3364293 RepID=UPI003C3018AB